MYITANGVRIMAIYIFLGVLVVVTAYFVFIYNALVDLHQTIKKSWSNIDVLLKQRHDELPKLIESCKAYMKHENETLVKLTEARSQVAKAREAGDVKGVGMAETFLRQGLGQLFAVVENYPDLKANQQFQQLQTRITALENMIADRRELYNETVNIFNIRIKQIPDVFVARFANYQPADLLKFSEEELKDVDVGASFGNN